MWDIYIPQPVQGLLSTEGWQALSLPVWKYSGTDQQPQTCGPLCTALTGRMGHLLWETQQTQMEHCQVWRQWLSIQWPSLPSLTAQCVQSSRPISPSTQHRVSDDGSESEFHPEEDQSIWSKRRQGSNPVLKLVSVNFNIIPLSHDQASWEALAWFLSFWPLIMMTCAIIGLLAVEIWLQGVNDNLINGIIL